jgi:hypothetical protein
MAQGGWFPTSPTLIPEGPEVFIRETIVVSFEGLLSECKNVARKRGTCPDWMPYKPHIWCWFCQIKAGLARPRAY